MVHVSWFFFLCINISRAIQTDPCCMWFVGNHHHLHEAIQILSLECTAVNCAPAFLSYDQYIRFPLYSDWCSSLIQCIRRTRYFQIWFSTQGTAAWLHVQIDQLNCQWGRGLSWGRAARFAWCWAVGFSLDACELWALGLIMSRGYSAWCWAVGAAGFAWCWAVGFGLDAEQWALCLMLSSGHGYLCHWAHVRLSGIFWDFWPVRQL